MPKLEEFDPTRPLVARTFFRLHGQIYQKGNAVPYSEVDDRVLRRNYDLRKISHQKDGEELLEVDTRTPEQRLQDGNRERRAQENATEDEVKSRLLGEEHITEEEQSAVDQLLADRANTHDALFSKASGVAGVTKSMKKAEIALALVRAGRGNP